MMYEYSLHGRVGDLEFVDKAVCGAIMLVERVHILKQLTLSVDNVSLSIYQPIY